MKSKLALLSVLLAAAGAASAQTAADYSVSYNLGAVSDYRYRGISQSAKRPALQGGADLAWKNGFYVGTWFSTIRWIKDSDFVGAGPRGPVELDIYGGYKGALTGDISYDVGGLYYWYVDNSYKRAFPGAENANTFELYGALSYGPATLKYSHSLTPLFGAPNSEGSGYLDLSATFDTGWNGITVTPHVGYNYLRDQSPLRHYTDYSLTAAKDFQGLVVSAAVVGTNLKHRLGVPVNLPGSGNRDLGKAGLVLGVKKNF